MLANGEWLTTDRATHALNLVHDEYLECLIAGHEEDYAEWAEFAAYCIAKIIIPEQRPA